MSPNWRPLKEADVKSPQMSERELKRAAALARVAEKGWSLV
jgi:hypothetical protein